MKSDRESINECMIVSTGSQPNFEVATLLTLQNKVMGSYQKFKFLVQTKYQVITFPRIEASS